MEWEHSAWMGNITYSTVMVSFSKKYHQTFTCMTLYYETFFHSVRAAATSPRRDVGGKKYCYKYYNMTLIVLMWEIFNVVVIVFFILKSLKISLHASHGVGVDMSLEKDSFNITIIFIQIHTHKHSFSLSSPVIMYVE